MIKAEIVIDEDLCQGCGYCIEFCSRDCLEITGDRFTAKGYLVPSVIKLENCTACGVCAWMCPAVAIEIYRFEPEPVTETDSTK